MRKSLKTKFIFETEYLGCFTLCYLKKYHFIFYHLGVSILSSRYKWVESKLVKKPMIRGLGNGVYITSGVHI